VKCIEESIFKRLLRALIYHHFTTIVKFVFTPMCPMQKMGFTCCFIYTCCGCHCFIMRSAFISACFRNSFLWIWHCFMFIFLSNLFSVFSIHPNVGLAFHFPVLVAIVLREISIPQYYISHPFRALYIPSFESAHTS